MASGVVSVAKFLLILGFASMLGLVFSMIFDPMFALMKLGVIRDILMFIFPKGLLILIFFVGVAALYNDLQGDKTVGSGKDE